MLGIQHVFFQIGGIMIAQQRAGALAIIASAIASTAVLGQSLEFRVAGVAKNDVLNMRAAPNADASVVSRIPPSASGIVRLGDCNEWCHVRYQGKVGWVSSRYIAEVPAPVTPEPPVAVSTDPIGDCNTDDAARRLAGCSALISRGTLPPTALAVAYSRRSDAHLGSGKLDAAITDRAKASELAPQDAAYRQRLSATYVQRAASWPLPGKLDAALKDYSDAIRADPASHEAYAGRSSMYLLTNDYDRAIAESPCRPQPYQG